MKLVRKTSMLAVALMLVQMSYAQDGAALFNSKCNACHLPDKISTGPILKGVKKKWADAGESELIYEWVRNSAALISTGKSKMATEISSFSASVMTNQDLKNEEIDAVLDYLDAYTPPPPPVTITTNGTVAGAEVTVVPDYKGNLKLFYYLLACTFVLIIAILIVSTSIITLVKSDFFRKKMQDKNGENKALGIALLLLSIGVSASQNSVFAMKFTAPGTSTELTPWLLVEKVDLYMLLGINIILLCVLLYLRNMFKNFMSMIKAEREPVTENKPLQRINKVLTDAVPVEEEAKIMLHHEYDGIRELDNNLPPWWVWGFVATIVFAIVYLFNYHVFKTGDLQLTAYEKEIKSADKEVKAYLSKMAMNVDENTATLLTDADAMSSGKSIFMANCTVCHNPKGEGNIGPNLTDKAWIYGFDIKEVFKTIKAGTPNGMPEHGSKLNPIQIQQVASYIIQLPETEGKNAQGTILEK